MAASKGTKKKKKSILDGDTPVTIGGGGGAVPKAKVPLTIDFDPTKWTLTPGKLTMVNGQVKTIKITAGELNQTLPIKGGVQIDLSCEKLLSKRR